MSTKKSRHVTSHVFAETTHVVAAPCVFACLVIPRRSYIFQVSSKTIQGFWSHGWVDFRPFPVLRLLAFTAACAMIYKRWYICSSCSDYCRRCCVDCERLTADYKGRIKETRNHAIVIIRRGPSRVDWKRRTGKLGTKLDQRRTLKYWKMQDQKIDT